MAADVVIAPAVRDEGGRGSRPADAARRLLGRLPREPRRADRPRRHLDDRADRHLRRLSSRRIRRSSSSATRCARRRSGTTGGTWRYRARHRRRRPRHAVAADLRRAGVAVHRPVGDERVVRDRRRARPARRRGGVAGRRRDHPRHGPDHGGAEPGDGDPGRRRARSEPRQHHRRGDDRLPAALRAAGARLGARRADQGLRHRRARRRRRAAAPDGRRPCCPIASRR